jgi:hypothetical protein
MGKKQRKLEEVRERAHGMVDEAIERMFVGDSKRNPFDAKLEERELQAERMTEEIGRFLLEKQMEMDSQRESSEELQHDPIPRVPRKFLDQSHVKQLCEQLRGEEVASKEETGRVVKAALRREVARMAIPVQEDMEAGMERNKGETKWRICVAGTEPWPEFGERLRKGTEKFWNPSGLDATLQIRGICLSRPSRWERFWRDHAKLSVSRKRVYRRRAA